MSITIPKFLLDPDTRPYYYYFELTFKTKRIEQWFKKNNIENDLEKFSEAYKSGKIFHVKKYHPKATQSK